MSSQSQAHDQYRIRCATLSGACSQLARIVEQTIHDLNQLRDTGAPEDVLEHYTTALTNLNQARRSLALAGSALWKRTGMRDGGKDGRS